MVCCRNSFSCIEVIEGVTCFKLLNIILSSRYVKLVVIILVISPSELCNMIVVNLYNLSFMSLSSNFKVYNPF